MWSALTCQRFGMRRLVDAVVASAFVFEANLHAVSFLRCFVHFWLPNPLLEIPRNLRADPFSNRDGDAIPDHSVSIIIASRESECVRDSLQPGVLSNRVRPRALRESLISH
jgi:hypothetical protein